MMKSRFSSYRRYALLITFLILSINGYTQGTKGFQFTFFYPLGTNGTEAVDYINKFSFNAIYGLNGGVDGFELGGVMNLNNGDVNGFQLGGVGNLDRGSANGMIFAGVLNVSQGSSGAMLAGTVNLNLAGGRGIQASVLNVTVQDFIGLQLGVTNYAGFLTGTQVGVVNIAMGAEGGTPFGLVSYVKDGFFQLEVMTGDVIYSNINYKMGVRHLYTIYKIGYTQYKGNPAYTYGLGFGTNLLISDQHNFSLDASSSYIAYDGKWNQNNQLSKLDFNYKYLVSDKISLVIGPSFNVYYSDKKVGKDFGTLNVPYTLLSSNNDKTVTWIGFNFGASFLF